MQKKPGLGKGLGALIPGPDEAAKDTEGAFLCPIERILANPVQPRKNFDDAALTSLAETIREHGILQPLIVRRAGADYELIAGERRLRAAKLAGLGEVPVVVKNVGDQDSLLLALIENLQRTDLNPIEEARGYKEMQDRFGLKQEEVAARVGRDRSSVANGIRLLQLPREIQEDLVSGELTAGHGRALLALANPILQLKIRALIKARAFSVRETEKLVLDQKEKKDRQATPPVRLDPDMQKIQDELRNHFGVKVRLQQGRKGGKLLIQYASLEELDRIYSLIIR
jgi:ParB family transcriptional regulator, chromosome partitioning protein